jgi:hypothetical protein
MHDLLRLSIYRQRIRNFLCIIGALYPVLVTAQALPSSTPPLLSPVPGYAGASNDARYGRTGSTPDAEVGRDRVYRGNTPANDASFTRYGRSTATSAAVAKSAVRLARSFPAIAMTQVMLDLASDLGTIWSRKPDGWQMERPIPDNSACSPIPAYILERQGNQTCRGLDYILQTIDGVCEFASSCKSFQDQDIVQWRVRFPMGTAGPPQYLPIPDTELEPLIANSPRLPDIARDIERMPQYDQSPEASKIPWSPEKVILPQPINLPESISLRPDGSKERTRTTLRPRDDGRGGIDWERIEERDIITPPNTPANPTAVTSTVPLGTTTSPEKLPEKKFCEENPSSIGCAELDTPDEPIPKTTKNITFEPSVVFGSGQCPADKVMNLRGSNITVFDWNQACGYIASYVRPIIISLASFAAFFIVAGVRTDQ